MKRLLMPFLASLIVLLSFAIPDAAQAHTLTGVTVAVTTSAETASPAELIEQLKSQFLPQVENILTPEQREQLETAVADGQTSLRKAFKSIVLTPAQKTKLATLLKSMPKKDFFTTMTPEQKKQLFMKKKEMFMPSAEEIAGYQAKKAEKTD